MTTFESKVLELCAEGEDPPYKTITRNLSYDIKKVVSGTFDANDNLKSASREDIILSQYKVENILEVINPELLVDISFLKKLRDAMQKLEEDKLTTNLILGIPKEC